MIPTFRPYQDAMIEGLRAQFRDASSVLGVLPTGGGKTVIGVGVVHLAMAKKTRVLWLAHRTELIEQASQKLDDFGLPHAIIKAGHPRQDLSQPVQVASVQTLVRRLDRLTGAAAKAQPVWGDTVPSWSQPFGLIVVDEAHHTSAGSYVAILEAWPNAKVLGLTATPYRLDGSGLGGQYQRLVVGAHVSRLIRDGYLVRTRTFAPPASAGLRQVRVRGADYALEDAARLLDLAAPIAEIVRTWQTHAAGRLTVGFACNVAHAQHLAEAFTAAGIPSASIDGDDDQGRRDQVLADLRAGRLRVVWNCQLLTEGWDLPAISAVILARPTKSRAMWRQQVGRGMRSAPGKADCVILDHVGNAVRFGLPDVDDEYALQQEADETRAAAAPACLICPGCHTAQSIHLAACLSCGRDLRREPDYRPRIERGERAGMGVQRQEIVLEEFRGLSETDRKRFYHQLLKLAGARGYNGGWSAHRYRERFGAYPPHAWRDEYEVARV